MPPMFDADDIVLIGMPGSGKSTVGHLLAQKIDQPFYDVDKMIVKDYDGTLSDMILDKGEAYFRHQEALICRSLLQHYTGVVALGGGSILNLQTRQMLKTHTVIYLEASLNHLMDRLEGDDSRPFLAGEDKRAALGRLYRERVDLYQACASFNIMTDGMTPEGIVSAIAESVAHPEPA